MKSLVFAVAVLCAACSGDKPKDVDANPAGPMCAGSAYDLCASEHDCTMGTCFPFGSFQVCTLPCTPGDSSSCPTQNGASVTCDSGGHCEPAAANHCHL